MRWSDAARPVPRRRRRRTRDDVFLGWGLLIGFVFGVVAMIPFALR